MTVNFMLDLDGVICDLDRKIQEVFGNDYNKIDDKNYLWNKLSEIDHLFLNLEPMPYYRTLFNYLKSLERIGSIHLEILTSLPYSTGKLVSAREDKIAWVRKYLDPDIIVNTVVGGAKKAQYVKHPTDILLDDMPRNIDAWINAGGTGILYKNNADAISKIGNILVGKKDL
jgi:hypothetical protein